MLAGPLFAGASCVHNPFVPVGAVLAKKVARARRVYRASPNSVWMTGFVVGGSVSPVSAGFPRARSNSYKSLRHRYLVRARYCLSLVAMPVNLAAQRSRAKVDSRTSMNTQARPRHPAQLEQVGYQQLRTARRTAMQLCLCCLCCLSGSAVSADRPLPDTRPACQL